MNDEDEGGLAESAADDSTTTTDIIHVMPSVTTVEVDLFLSLDDSKPWNPDDVFAFALHDLFDAMVPPACVADAHVHTDGDLKAKERASNAVLKHGINSTSRSPSRASSRAQSTRVSAALSASIMTMQMARLAFGKSNGDAPFRINEWNESDDGAGLNQSKAGAYSVDPHATMSSRFSLASSRTTARTSRIPVDHQEIRRREEITRDIATREGREKLTARIQRKGELKLRLRSLADPNISFDREEYETQKKSREAVNSRSMSRGSPTAAMERPALARIGSLTDNAFGTTTSRSTETTYRSEDYEGLCSDVVIMGTKGELLVSENCSVIARKPRIELHHDMLQRNTIQPRIHVAKPHEPEAQEEVVSAVGSSPRRSPNRVVSRQSPVRPVDIPEPNPVFEGLGGTIKVYAKIELDPKKTHFAKGVKLQLPEPPSVTHPAASLPLKEIVHLPSHGTPKPTNSSTILSEDHPNEPIESALQNLIRSADKSKQQRGYAKDQPPLGSHAEGQPLGGQTSSRHTTHTGNTGSSVSVGHQIPVRSHHGDKYQLQSLRLRTPAYGNRSGHGGAAVLGISFGEILDDDSVFLHHAVDETASLYIPKKPLSAASLPKFSPYIREFPSPPTGHIHVVSTAAAATLLTPPAKKIPLPFSSLPSVIRGKR